MGQYSREQRRVKLKVLIAWEKPWPSYVKLNVDGSAKGQPGEVTGGGIICDDKGNWIVGFTYKVGVLFSLTTELWALYQRLKLCWERGFKKELRMPTVSRSS
ncbi:Uncharacterized protein TCM_040555 [Theobroma cacao]|uniref:RNase H type-1 domain-containing protein n=1 Tax=Theobroma cacao TaxID=3641 RepID=A0A061GT21_THECC|nr:Uncharacterized protein TCM_040555 [Theobroma cacao]